MRRDAEVLFTRKQAASRNLSRVRCSLALAVRETRSRWAAREKTSKSEHEAAGDEERQTLFPNWNCR